MDSLTVAPCSHEAAKYAVMHWHYSRLMPIGKLVKYGVWENGCFVGAVMFSRGASWNLGMPYGLDQTTCVELTRIALTSERVSPVSQVASRAVALLHASNPKLRLVMSFADPVHGHHGGIYQAMNWLYASAQESIATPARWTGRCAARSPLSRYRTHLARTKARQ